LKILEHAYPRYIKELDGLRGLAILGVVLFHLHLPGLSLGWAGVQLFFVISGYLITRILLESKGQPYYLRNFYILRSLRIFPIYYLVLIGKFVLLAVTHSDSPLHAVFAGASNNPWQLLPYYLTYTQTIPQIQSQYTDLPFLTHTWTLAIEEQFYWIWPFAVLLLNRKAFVTLAVALFFVAIGTRAVALFVGSDNPFLTVGILPAQLESLAAGALVAVAVTTGVARNILARAGWLALGTGSVGLVALLLRSGMSGFWEPATWATKPQNIFLLTTFALLFAGVVALAVSGSRWTMLFTNPFLTRVGRVSYGIYLYHAFAFLAIDALVQTVQHDVPWWDSPIGVVEQLGLGAAKIGLTFAIAAISWRFIEVPLVSLKDRFTKRGRLATWTEPAAPQRAHAQLDPAV
jgi:peptidoglycan/LPS O-acetylase OafA/YrhL